MILVVLGVLLGAGGLSAAAYLWMLKNPPYQ